MNDTYERWVEGKRRDVPDGFADRVMARVGDAPGRLERWWRQPLVRAAVWVAACFALAARLAFAGGVFLFH